MTQHPPPAPAPAPLTPPLPTPARLTPVPPGERLSSVDTLRGFALLGILAMNIIAFALPGSAYMDPAMEALEPYQGPFTGLNLLSWWIVHLLFDQKMMSTFSMLFGAGLVLMGGRAQARTPDSSRGFAAIYYRRLFWLFVIGMVHAHLIWYGDILVAYAICGVLLYPLRRLRPGSLLALGSALFLIAVPVNLLLGGSLLLLEHSAAEVRELIDAGKPVTSEQRELLKGFEDAMAEMSPSPEKIGEHIGAMRDRLPTVIRENSRQAVMMQTLYFFIWTIWRATGLMLIGMGLMKLGVFGAGLSARAYTRLALIGYALGYPLVIIGAVLLNRYDFDPLVSFAFLGHFNYLGSLGVALGHVGVIMLICKLGALPGMRERLAAVGRMALTNYLMQSVLLTAVFYGWGLGYFGRFERATLYLFVLGVWALELIWSPIWLRHFRFGPAEWLWRTLTYWKVQPMTYQAK